MEELNLGKVVGPKGDSGSDGFSPEIRENAANGETVYKLDITTAAGTLTTPNLKGPKGDPAGVSVASFNGRAGDVIPESGDYTAEMVGAATMEQVNTAIQTAVLDSWGKEY